MGYLYIVFMIFLTTLGQLLTKMGSRRINLDKGLLSILNPYTIAAGIIILIAPLFYILALKHLSLSIAFAFTGLNYVFVSLGEKIFLKEQLNKYHYLGMASIAIGVALFGL